MIWLAIAVLMQTVAPGVYYGRVLTEEEHNEAYRFITTPSPNTSFIVVGNSITVQPKTGAARAAQIVNSGLQKSFYFHPDPLGIDDDFNAYAYRRIP